MNGDVTDDGSGRVLLRDVARLAGVSMGAASMALRGQGSIPLKTCNRVRGIAEQLGYRPNLAASMLARGERERGVLNGVPVALIGMGVKKQHAFPAAEFIAPFLQHATEKGLLVEEAQDSDSFSVSRQLRILYHRGVRGILLSHSFDTTQLTEEDVKPFSFLLYGQPLKETRFHRVANEVFDSTRLLWETIWDRGYRRIGAALYRHPQDISDDFAREAAVINCQIRHKAPKVPIFTGALGDARGLVQWAKKVRPDAVIGFSMSQHYKLLEAGFKIPEEIGYAALHVFGQNHPIAGMCENFDELGRVAASQLDAMIRHNETGFARQSLEILVPPVFVEGRTLPLRKP